MLPSILLSLAAVVALIVRAMRADTRLAHHARLPMNWSLTGRATWTAPRRLALATVPALAALVFVLVLANPAEGLAAPLQVLLLSAAFGVLQSVQLRLSSA